MNHQNQIQDIYDTSPLQNGLLFHSLYARESTTYVVQLRLRLTGRLDAPAFSQAWQILVERHPVFRTSFHWRGLEHPVQVVRGNIRINMQQHDWRGISADLMERKLEDFFLQDRLRGFDLSSAALMRLSLLRTRDDQHEFVFTFHHLVLDGWSSSIIMRELFICYEALRKGGNPHLPESVPYRNYISWLKEQDIGRAQAFWKKEFENFTAPTLLTAGNSGRIAEHKKSMGEYRIRFHAADLSQFVRRQQVTLSTLLLSVWGVLLGCYTNSEDVVFGNVVSGRPPGLPQVEAIVGLFINTLPVRLILPQQETVSSWLRKLHRKQAEARRFEYTPLPELHAWVGVPADQPLFDALLIFENYPVDSSLREKLPGIEISDLAFSENPNYPFVIWAEPAAPEFMVRFTYDISQFRDDAIARLAGHYRHLLEQMLENPEQPLSQLRLLTGDERERILVEWNQTERAFPAQSCLHQLFEEQVKRSPDAVAIVDEGQQLAFFELNQRACRLANYLKRFGAVPEMLVGIHLERSLDMIVAILGVLKTGCAYLPIDSNYPLGRIAFVLEDSKMKLLLTQEDFAERFSGHNLTKVIKLDTESQQIAKESGEFNCDEAGSENLAYVIYTSGSTGRPKGVQVPHRAIINCVKSFEHALGISSKDIVIASTNLSFDIAALEIVLPLLAGARIVLARHSAASHPAQLISLIEESKSTLVQATPSSWRMLLKAGWQGKTGLQILCGGEALDEQLAGQLVLRTRAAWNVYGPTETAIWSTACRLFAKNRDVSIGRPIDNTEVYVLNRGLEPAPIGVAGELYIGGAGVARGYLGQAGLTAERFVPHLYSERPGERLYRTGDLARYGANGELEFLGRTDHQVKIRGYRIELGEIEAALRQQEGVREAVVVVREEGAGDQRLLGYVVWESQEPFAARELKARLRQSLPEYMVPGTLVRLERMPLNPSGKVDRKALPGPEDAGGEERENLVAPRTATEEIVAGIWGEVLKREGVGEEDNFFEMGGHSLLAMQVISRVEEVLECEVSLRAVFEQPTVSRFARSVEEARRVARKPARSVGSGKGEEGPVPLSFSQERLWFLDRLEPGSAFYNIAAGLRLRGRLEVKWLEEAWRRIVERHEALRTRFMLEGEGPVQVVEAAGGVELEVVDLRGWEEEKREIEAARQAGQEAQQGFDLESGPMWRMKLLRLGEQEHVLLLVLHHIVADGWSLGLLFGELSELYRARREGREAKLEELRWQYRDYARWQREWLQGEVLGEQMEYWRKQLSGAPGILELPVDRARPPVQSYRGGHHRFVINTETTKKLKELSRREGVTLFMTLLGGFKTLLCRYSGRFDIVVGSGTAGRNRTETEKVIGCFINSLVLRTDLSGNPTFKELLGRVRNVTIGAYEHQELPFEKLVETLRPVRNRSYHPIFQAMVTLHEGSDFAVELPDVEITPFELATDTARMDLILSVTEDPKHGLVVSVEYNSDVFEASTIAQIGSDFNLLLAEVVTNPDARILEISFAESASEQVITA